MRFILLSVAITLLGVVSASVSAASIQPVYVGELQWLQPKDFAHLRWVDVEDVCDTQSGACNGVLNGVDLTGWTWASVGDINDLFNSFIGNAHLMGPDSFYSFGSSEIKAFLDAGFAPTLTVSNDELNFVAVWGFTRTLALPVLYSAYAGLALYELNEPFAPPSRFATDVSADTFNFDNNVGYFFYRVPVSSSFWLVAVGLAVLIVRPKSATMGC